MMRSMSEDEWTNDIERVYQKYVRKRFSLPTEKEVAALEERINAKFPPEYRWFLLRYNGGWFKENSLENFDDRISGRCVDCLYGIKAGHESAELGNRADMALFDDNDPPQIVIIGNTVMNQLIVLGVHPENYGEIYFKTFTEFIFMTDSLEEFFGMISDPLEEDA